MNLEVGYQLTKARLAQHRRTTKSKGARAHA
jgi:hypothetical protein